MPKYQRIQLFLVAKDTPLQKAVMPKTHIQDKLYLGIAVIGDLVLANGLRFRTRNIAEVRLHSHTTMQSFETLCILLNLQGRPGRSFPRKFFHVLESSCQENLHPLQRGTDCMNLEPLQKS